MSLEEANSNISIPDEIVAEYLIEDIAVDLILEICRLVIYNSKTKKIYLLLIIDHNLNNFLTNKKN